MSLSPAVTDPGGVVGTGADPRGVALGTGFLVGEGANHPGAPTYNFAKISKNCMKLRTFWVVRGTCRLPL